MLCYTNTFYIDWFQQQPPLSQEYVNYSGYCNQGCKQSSSQFNQCASPLINTVIVLSQSQEFLQILITIYWWLCDVSTQPRAFGVLVQANCFPKYDLLVATLYYSLCINNGIYHVTEPCDLHSY